MIVRGDESKAGWMDPHLEKSRQVSPNPPRCRLQRTTPVPGSNKQPRLQQSGPLAPASTPSPEAGRFFFFFSTSTPFPAFALPSPSVRSLEHQLSPIFTTRQTILRSSFENTWQEVWPVYIGNRVVTGAREITQVD